MENLMRKMIMMAIAGFLWKKFGGKSMKRPGYPRNYRGF